MSLKRIISLLALSILTAAFSAVSFGQETKPDAPKADTTRKMRHEGRGGDRLGKGMRGGHFGRRGGFGGLRGITLTDAQKEQIRAIRQANKPDTALMQELRTIRQSRKSGTDLTAEQKARVTAIRDQMRVKAQAMHDQIQNVLTAEQKAEIEKFRAERKQRMEQFRERRQEMRRNRDATRPKAADGTTTRPKTN
jgi:Spy/CpxP family protein refolding chaperone